MPRLSLPDDLIATLVDMRDRADPRLLQMVHRIRDVGWPMIALAPILGIRPATINAQISRVADYDPALLPAIPAPPTPSRRPRPTDGPAPHEPRALMVAPAGRAPAVKAAVPVPAAPTVLAVAPPPGPPSALSPPPGSRPRGIPSQQFELATRLRVAGCTWVQIATELRRTFQLAPMAAMRVAHLWSQSDVSARWRQRWPHEKKTNKNISYWERWSAGKATGHAPLLPTLARLAELYECAMTDLLGRYGDFRHLDQAGPGEPIDSHHQYALGQMCPHGCTVLAYAPSDREPEPATGTP